MLLVGMKAIAEYCGISIPGLQGWIARKAFPAIKVQGTWQISTEQIKQWRQAVMAVKGKQILQAYSPPPREVIVKIKDKKKGPPKTRSMSQYRAEKVREATAKMQERWEKTSTQPRLPSDRRGYLNPQESKLRLNLRRSLVDPSEES